MSEVRIRASRRLGVFALAAGVLGLAVVVVFESMRHPILVLAVGALVLSGALLVVDRRVKLAISNDGIRYARWGPATVPWREFAGYHWASWRGQPHLQLLARRPTELVESFSAYGRLNHLCYRLARMPPFSIAVTQLDASPAVLDDLLARHLPEQPYESS